MEQRDFARKIISLGEERANDKELLSAMEEYKNLYGEDGFYVNYLGCMYDDGIAVEEDNEKAFECFKRASEMGFAPAFANVALAYTRGRVVERNYKTALEYYQKAAELGNLYSFAAIGDIYYYGRGDFDTDHEKALEYYRKAAEKGSALGLFRLSDCYRVGHGVEKNEELADEYLERSARAGYTLAQKTLAEMYSGRYYYDYEKSQKMRNLNKALEYYQMISDSKNDSGGATAYVIARFHYERKYASEIEPNLEKAYEYLLLAEQRGNYGARTTLNLVKAIGITQPFTDGSDEEDIATLQEYLAEKTGELEYVRVMAFRYAFGVGIEENPQKALELYKKLYEQNDERGAYQYGWCYAHGIGTEKDEERAVEIWKKAAELGSENAKKSLELRGK